LRIGGNQAPHGSGSQQVLHPKTLASPKLPQPLKRRILGKRRVLEIDSQ
jgi:hypothetical protein